MMRLAIGSLRLFLPTFFLFMAVGCHKLCCADKVVNTVPSPDGKHVVVALDRDCGATTIAATGVYMRATSWFQFGDGDELLAFGSSQVVRISWLGGRQLQIGLSVEAAQHVLRKETRCDGVDIVYATVASPGSP
jgi:hypothetical protein